MTINRLPRPDAIPGLDALFAAMEVAGTAASLMSDHVGAENPHSQYALGTSLGTLALVVSGKLDSGSTTAAISDSFNRRYVTDEQLELLLNTSGTNTGDQDLSGYSQIGHTHAISEVTGLQTALDLKADLIGGVIPSSQLPALVKTDVHTVANEAAMLALTAQSGDIAIRTDLSKTFVHSGGSSGTAADWSELISPTDAVTSVNGLIGNITLGYGDVGAAAAIHYHTITDVSGLQTALDGKAASSHTHTISDLTDLPAIAKSSTGNALVQANATGTINDSFLPTYIAKMNVANTFTKAQTITAGSDVPANVIDGLLFSVLNAFPGGGSAGQYKDAIFGLGVSVPHVLLCGGAAFTNNGRGHLLIRLRTDGNVFNDRFYIDYLGRVAFNHTSPKATVHGSGSTILGVAASAIADADIGNGQANFYLDESGHNLQIKIKYSNGTIRTATIALVA